MGIKATGDRPRDGRDRLLRGAVSLLAEKGFAGMELRDVAVRGDAPRGSIYHHFPGGKVQLAEEAAALEGERIRLALEDAIAEHGIDATLVAFGNLFLTRARNHAELVGCPVAAAALARPEDPALAAAASAAFEGWEKTIAGGLEQEGVDRDAARAFSVLAVATIEGALLRARAAGDDQPLDDAIRGLRQALTALLPS